MDNTSSLNLFTVFIQGFDVNYIYEQGWEAARQWMMLVSGVLVAIAVMIRSTEEQVNLLKGGQAGWNKMIVDVLLLAVAMGLYFTVASLVVDIFNAIYVVLSNSPMQQMTAKLDTIMKELFAKDYEFKISDIGDSFLSIAALIGYGLTHMILVLIVLAMRIAHAVLVSFVLFYGAIAIPISMTQGLKQLTGFKNIAVMVLLWPIIERFFMFLIGGAFTVMLEGSELDVEQFDTFNMGMLVFYLSAFSVINLLLAASFLSAPFIAQSMANNTGNTTGMIGSFAAAGVAAAAITSKALLPQQGGGIHKGAISAANKLTGKNEESLGGVAASSFKGVAGDSLKAVASGASLAKNSIFPTKQEKPTPSLGVGLTKPSEISGVNSNSTKRNYKTVQQSEATQSKETVSPTQKGSENTKKNISNNKSSDLSKTATSKMTDSLQGNNRKVGNTQDGEGSSKDEFDSNSIENDGSSSTVSSESDKKKKRQRGRAGYFSNKAKK